jgi:hypothetical protein
VQVDHGTLGSSAPWKRRGAVTGPADGAPNREFRPA